MTSFHFRLERYHGEHPVYIVTRVSDKLTLTLIKQQNKQTEILSDDDRSNIRPSSFLLSTNETKITKYRGKFGHKSMISTENKVTNALDPFHTDILRCLIQYSCYFKQNLM